MRLDRPGYNLPPNELVSEKDVSDALDLLSNEEGAAWRGTHTYLDALTKSLLGKLLKDSDEKSVVAREADARSQPEFVDHLRKLKEAMTMDHKWRLRYAAAEAKIEIWRTLQANGRRMDKIG